MPPVLKSKVKHIIPIFIYIYIHTPSIMCKLIIIRTGVLVFHMTDGSILYSTIEQFTTVTVDSTEPPSSTKLCHTGLLVQAQLYRWHEEGE